MTRSLVLARVGCSSLHPSWVDRGTARPWDLRLLPYTELPEQVDADWTVADVVPGPKWSGLREHLNSWDGWREYDYVWMPDDDLFASQSTITAMFDIGHGVGLDLFAPALHDSSFYAHFDTMRNHSFYGRWSGFVEIMMPVFSVPVLEELLPTFDLSDTGWGWGFDSLWPALLDHRNVGVIDATPVLHTRPVGVMRDATLQRRIYEESDRILSTHGCEQVHTTYGAFGADLKPLDLDQNEFFAQLVSGWQHLVDADPRVLTWLLQYQRGEMAPLPYPVQGTP
jgi:hypothetical protein